jgi:hypothetical protein
MSDGPHRSLPMRRHWKDLAERSAKAAFSPDQVSEALPHALKKEIPAAPIKEIRDIMGSDTLFSELRIERLDALRQTHRSAAATHVIDCAIAAAASGLTGEAGTHAALQNALQDTTRFGELKNTTSAKPVPVAPDMCARGWTPPANNSTAALLPSNSWHPAPRRPHAPLRCPANRVLMKDRRYDGHGL